MNLEQGVHPSNEFECSTPILLKGDAGQSHKATVGSSSGPISSVDFVTIQEEGGQAEGGVSFVAPHSTGRLVWQEDNEPDNSGSAHLQHMIEMYVRDDFSPEPDLLLHDMLKEDVCSASSKSSKCCKIDQGE